MALIKCSECGKKVSDKAKVCVNCGCPLEIENIVKVKFPRGKQTVNMGCTVTDEEGNVLAKCREGEIAIFEISEETTIYVHMKSRIGKASTVACPGDRFEVNLRNLGIGISKVDIL